MTVAFENDHNVYILGAGFSDAGGMPTMAPFLSRMREAHEWLESNNRSTEAQAISEVLQFRLEAAGAAYRVPLEVENIEHLFSLADATPSARLPERLSSAIAATLAFAAAQVPDAHRRLRLFRDPPHISSWPATWEVHEPEESTGGRRLVTAPLYDFLVGVMTGYFQQARSRTKNTIITFNYDLLVEDALVNLSVPFTYGFDRAGYAQSARCVRSHHQAVSVLKLHGSVNWAHRQRVGRGPKFTVFGSYDDVRADGSTPIIVPPTWKKVFVDQLATVWDRAVGELQGATRIVVAGFSMPSTDLHFQYLLAAGLQKNISLREVVVVDLKVSSMRGRIKLALRSSVPLRTLPMTVASALLEQRWRACIARTVDAPWFYFDGVPQHFTTTASE